MHDMRTIWIHDHRHCLRYWYQRSKVVPLTGCSYKQQDLELDWLIHWILNCSLERHRNCSFIPCFCTSSAHLVLHLWPARSSSALQSLTCLSLDLHYSPLCQGFSSLPDQIQSMSQSRKMGGSPACRETTEDGPSGLTHPKSRPGADRGVLPNLSSTGIIPNFSSSALNFSCS